MATMYISKCGFQLLAKYSLLIKIDNLEIDLLLQLPRIVQLLATFHMGSQTFVWTS